MNQSTSVLVILKKKKNRSRFELEPLSVLSWLVLRILWHESMHGTCRVYLT